MPSPRLALYIFLGWAIVQALLLVASHARGKAVPAMRLAVEKVSSSEPESEKEQMAVNFIWISVIWFALITSVAAFTFLSAAGGSVFGLVVFVGVGVWSVYQEASSPFVLGKMYPGSINWFDWLLAALGTLVWGLLFVVLIAKWM
jgi:hypothetical protein